MTVHKFNTNILYILEQFLLLFFFPLVLLLNLLGTSHFLQLSLLCYNVPNRGHKDTTAHGRWSLLGLSMVDQID